MVGQVLCYVATVDGEWVALLGWASAALQVKARDAWMGWSDDQRHRRLRYIANRASKTKSIGFAMWCSTKIDPQFGPATVRG